MRGAGDPAFVRAGDGVGEGHAEFILGDDLGQPLMDGSTDFFPFGLSGPLPGGADLVGYSLGASCLILNRQIIILTLRRPSIACDHWQVKAELRRCDGRTVGGEVPSVILHFAAKDRAGRLD